MRIGVLDDDPLVQEFMRAAIEQLGHSCYLYSDGTSLLIDLRTRTLDLLVVDWYLPDMEGPQVVQSVRQSIGSNMPILFVTRRGSEEDVVQGLSSGADDFMTKPVRMGELLARIQALLRRSYPETQMAHVVEFGVYRFDTEKRTLEVRGEPVDIKHREFNLALFMFQNCGRLLSRDHVREMVWGQLTPMPSRSLDTHISRLRNKLHLKPENGYVVTAVYGVGYRLEQVEADGQLTEPAALPGNA
ncbi:DNA-binding response regulator [Vandammella animalimorsus]|uniref:DNA-binding response regulator n=1 Tax=Vandammella animalimorsus TaxID=2029117 RepID=A0A2A2AH43_9BURK|nr:response regulator transcription factor [Vandammella animalimorsus]PAT37051.1 DNA-binding response regulator [Vandammella animalimorsus]PAT37878.1 DNA-binding response regulator [Vandammella animalimorsus]